MGRKHTHTHTHTHRSRSHVSFAPLLVLVLASSWFSFLTVQPLFLSCFSTIWSSGAQAPRGSAHLSFTRTLAVHAVDCRPCTKPLILWSVAVSHTSLACSTPFVAARSKASMCNCVPHQHVGVPVLFTCLSLFTNRLLAENHGSAGLRATAD